MNEILLQVNAMNDVTFTFGDLITIGCGLIMTVSVFLKLQFDQKADSKATVVRFETMEKEHEKEVSDLKDNILHVQNGKRALKKDLIGMIEKETGVLNRRVDKTNERAEEDKKENQAEFKEINGKLNKILGLLENK